MPSLSVAIEANRAKQGAAEFAAATNQIKNSAAGVDNSVKKTDRALGGLGAQIGNVAVGMVGLAAVYKGLRLAISSTKEFAAFELGLANVSTQLTDQTMKYLPMYSRQIEEMSIKYGQATSVMSKGLYDVLSAGIDASKGITVLNVAAKAAIGGLSSTAVAADALTTILNSYRLTAKDSTRISDILFTTVKWGKITFEELASTIGQVAALAATSGLSLEEVGAALATMTRSGLSAEIAVTSLKGILTTFLSPTTDSIKAAGDLGIALNTTTLRSIGLTGAMQMLSKASAEQLSAIFPNVRALTGLATLAQDHTGHMRDLSSVTNSAGSSMEAFGKIADTTAQQMAKSKEVLASIKRDIGSALAPWFIEWARGLEILKGNWDENSKAMMRWWEITKLVRKSGLTSKEAEIQWTSDEALKGLKAYAEELDKVFAEIAKNSNQGTPATHWSALEEQEEAAKNAANAFPQLTEAQIKAGKSMSDLFAIIKAEKALLTLTDDERERSIELIKFEAEAKIASADNAEQLVAMYEGELKTLQNLKKQKEATATVESLFAELKAEKELIGVTNDERERAIKLIELEAAAKISNADNSDAVVQAYKDELDAMRQQRKEAEEMQKYYDAVEESMAGALQSPLTALLDNTRDIGDVLKDELTNLATDVLSLMYEDVITKPLMGAIKASVAPAMGDILKSITSMLRPIVSGVASGIGSIVSMGISAAFGSFGTTALPSTGGSPLTVNAANGATIKRCGKGDILSGPTIFPMSNGGLALGGEAGEEGLFPLGRDSQGRLGVRAAGSDAKSEPQSIKIINVMDQSAVQEYVNSADGERQIINIMQRNSHLMG